MDTTVRENDDKIERLKQDYETCLLQKQEIERQKDDEIKELKHRIDEMSSDFADMLRDTLNKMKDRIDIANRQWDEENDGNTLKNIENLQILKQ